MTIREFYLSVINGTGTSEETMQKARELLEKHDASNDKRKGTETKEKKEAAAHFANLYVQGTYPKAVSFMARECQVLTMTMVLYVKSIR